MRRMKRHLVPKLFFLILSLTAASSGWAARLALVIGNDAYSQIVPLTNARNDAKLMTAVLKKAGFDTTAATDLGRNALWNTIDTFKARIQKGDEVVFYFAGHGVQIGANQLLLPTDIAAQNDSQVQRDGVSLVDVQDALKDARIALMVIDACRDNPFPKTGTRAIGGTRGLAAPDPSTGQIIMMSAGRNQRALDRVPGESQANGLFTWELAQVLQTPGLEIRNALEQVKDRVDDKARRAGHEQRPSLVNDLRGSFYLLTGASVQVASIKPEPAAATALPGQTSGLSLEDLEKEEATRKQWQQWQARMKTDFDKTAAFDGSNDLQAKAWERFLTVWAQDNPLSREDEALRMKAQSRQEQSRRQVAIATNPPEMQPSSGLATSTAHGLQVVKIGHVAPMTGAQAHYGRDNENGVRMAIDDLNAQNVVIGGRATRFELVPEDDAATPSQGPLAAQRLCSAGVAGVVGHLNSGTSIPAALVYNQCGIPHISGAATNPRLTQLGYKTTFRIIANDNALGVGLANYAADTLGARRVAIIDDRTAYGAGVADTFKRTALARGIQVVEQQYTNDKATDFMTILLAIRAKSPDAIFYGGMDPQAGPMIRQMDQLGMNNIKFIGGDGICTSELAKLAAGSVVLDNAFCAEGGASLASMPGGTAWKSRYDAKYSANQFQVYSPYTYDATFVLVDAMKRAASVDPRIYTAKLQETNYRGVTSTITFDANGDLLNPPITIYKYRNGRKTALN